MVMKNFSELSSRRTDAESESIEDKFISIIKSESIHQWKELTDREKEIQNERKISIDKAYEKLEERLGRLLDAKVCLK